MNAQNIYSIRALTPEDIGSLHRLIRAVAGECGELEAVQTTPEQLLGDAFGAHPRFEALVAEKEGEVIGFCLYFYMYSSWKGIRTMYLEDLFVLPPYRKQGAGRALLEAVSLKAFELNMNLAWEADRDDLELRHIFTTSGAIDRHHKISYFMDRPALSEIAEKKKAAQ
jgi:GNAT superfamily N-acetyltransferase